MNELRELAEQWRKRGRTVNRRNGMYGSLVLECADELTAVLDKYQHNFNPPGYSDKAMARTTGEPPLTNGDTP